MITSLPLRGYQQDTIDKAHAAWASGLRRIAVVIPTGGGKTVIFAHMAVKGTLVLVHRDELINQAVDKLMNVKPELSIGVVKAARNDVRHDVIVASVQTLHKPMRLAMLPKINLVIVDEAHHAAAKTYMSILTGLGCFTETGPNAIGFSATLVRGDKLSLGDVWEKVVQHIDILDLITTGWLVDPRGIKVTVDGLSLSEVKRTRGDLSAVSLSDLMLDADAQDVVAAAYVKHASDRQGILFAPTVKAAQAFADAFRSHGIKTDAIWDGMGNENRALVLKRFAAGDIQVISNCMILTEGYDAPFASCVVIARPTTSAGLYVQMVGRGLRTFPGKPDCLVIDVLGTSEEHDLATLADLSSKRVDVVEPGETLTGAARRLKAAGHPALTGYVGHADVDLFRNAVSLWLKTEAGLWFIALEKDLVFLWPGNQPDVFNVGVCPTSARGGQWVRTGLILSDAMELAEAVAREADHSKHLTTRKASWRRRKDYPTNKQLTFATQLHIKIPIDITKPGLADLITIKLASIRLDGDLPK